MSVCVLWFSVWDSLSLSLARSLSLFLTHTHAHARALVSLATLLRRLLPPTPSRLRGRRARPNAARSSGRSSRRDQREGSAWSSTHSGHQSADTPKSFSVFAEVYSHIFCIYIWRIAQVYMGVDALKIQPNLLMFVKSHFLNCNFYVNPAPFTPLIHLDR